MFRAVISTLMLVPGFAIQAKDVDKELAGRVNVLSEAVEVLKTKLEQHEMLNARVMKRAAAEYQTEAMPEREIIPNLENKLTVLFSRIQEEEKDKKFKVLSRSEKNTLDHTFEGINWLVGACHWRNCDSLPYSFKKTIAVLVLMELHPADINDPVYHEALQKVLKDVKKLPFKRPDYCETPWMCSGNLKVATKEEEEAAEKDEVTKKAYTAAEEKCDEENWKAFYVWLQVHFNENKETVKLWLEGKGFGLGSTSDAADCIG